MAGSRLQHLADQEAEKLALGIGADPDPYALERPLERANRVRTAQQRRSSLNAVTDSLPLSSRVHLLLVNAPL